MSDSAIESAKKIHHNIILQILLLDVMRILKVKMFLIVIDV